ncbi:MAG: YkgJ family cysteine cluster protein [Promethearchaeota archaeon]
MCGTCCHEIPGEYKKRIPLYPEEVDKLIEMSKKLGVQFRVIEDLVFPDIKNEKILIITYRISLENDAHGCPFYIKNKGCIVHNVKPLACQAYPLTLKRIDAFNFEISIDPLCSYVIENYNELENLDLEKLKKIFKDEYPKAENFFRKNKNLMFEIRKLEVTKEIEIPREISLDSYNLYLTNWDRVEIRV